MTPTEWLLSGDTGTSSETICAVMTNSRGKHIGSPPLDNDDFGRCYRLLRLFPMWRHKMKDVAAIYPAWGPLVQAWDELTAMWEAYCDPVTGRVGAKEYAANKEAASKLYNRMKVLLDEGRIADGWKRTGEGSWSKGEQSITRFGNMEIKA